MTQTLKSIKDYLNNVRLILQMLKVRCNKSIQRYRVIKVYYRMNFINHLVTQMVLIMLNSITTLFWLYLYKNYLYVIIILIDILEIRGYL